MPSSRGSSRPRNRTPVFCGFCISGGFFTTEPSTYDKCSASGSLHLWGFISKTVDGKKTLSVGWCGDDKGDDRRSASQHLVDGMPVLCPILRHDHAVPTLTLTLVITFLPALHYCQCPSGALAIRKAAASSYFSADPGWPWVSARPPRTTSWT